PVPDRSGDALAVLLAGVEVLFAGAHQGRPIQRRSPAEDASHVKTPLRAVDTHRPVIVRLFVDQHRLLVVNRFLQDRFTSSLQKEDSFPGSRTGVSESPPSRPTTDHDNIIIAEHGTSGMRMRRAGIIPVRIHPITGSNPSPSTRHRHNSIIKST